METVSVEKYYEKGNITYHLTHPTSDESIVLNKDELIDLYAQLHNLITPKKPKLIIHETDCHGCGNVYYKGKTDRYSYDDGSFGDVRATIDALIDFGFIDPNEVVILEDDEIYNLVEKGLDK
jgi:hypothetical protein